MLKDSDWLKEKATKTYEKYKGNLWTTGFVVAEILLNCKKYNLDPETVIVNLYLMIDVKGLEQVIALIAAHYIKNKKINVFDALHAAYAQYDEIISSDHVFDELGLDRIKLERQ